MLHQLFEHLVSPGLLSDCGKESVGSVSSLAVRECGWNRSLDGRIVSLCPDLLGHQFAQMSAGLSIQGEKKSDNDDFTDRVCRPSGILNWCSLSFAETEAAKAGCEVHLVVG